MLQSDSGADFRISIDFVGISARFRAGAEFLTISLDFGNSGKSAGEFACGIDRISGKIKSPKIVTLGSNNIRRAPGPAPGPSGARAARARKKRNV